MRIVSLLFWLGTVVFAHGGIVLLGTYEFTGTSTADNQFNQVTAQPEHAGFSPVARVNVGWNQGANVFNSRNWSMASVIDLTEYVEFSITANPGYTLTLDHLLFSAERTSTGPAHGAVKLFQESDPVAAQTFSYTVPDPMEQFRFQDLDTTGTDSATFRFYGYNAGSGSGTLRFDNISLYGSVDVVPVPEPIEWALIIFGGVFFVSRGVQVWQRRRQPGSSSPQPSPG